MHNHFLKPCRRCNDYLRNMRNQVIVHDPSFPCPVSHFCLSGNHSYLLGYLEFKSFQPERHATQKARLYYLIYSKLCFTAKKHRHQPCLCLCLGFSQMIMMFPFLLITLHFSQIGFTEALTFILSPPFKKHLASFFLIYKGFDACYIVPVLSVGKSRRFPRF